jgi:pimeloyl-ACP methyl ester carboxylesterase
VQGDVANPVDLDRLFAQIKREKVKLDIVFVNAGAAQFASLGKIPDEHYDALFDSNVKGLLFTVQKALPLMPDGASIILNAFIAASIGSPEWSVYNATKAAVRSFARTWTMVVPILFCHRTRPGGLRQISARFCQAVLADRFAKVEVRQHHIRTHCGILQQPGSCRYCDSYYRCRLRVAEGESKYDDLEKRLAEFPVITVPTITLQGDADGAPRPDPSSYAKKFAGKYSHRLIKGGIGHNLPQEAPQAFAQAVVDVDRY